jgi:hypothetical protein
VFSIFSPHSHHKYNIDGSQIQLFSRHESGFSYEKGDFPMHGMQEMSEKILKAVKKVEFF